MITILRWLPVQKNVHHQGVILARVHREWKSWFLEIALFASIYTPYIPVQIKSNLKKKSRESFYSLNLSFLLLRQAWYMVSIFLLTYALNNSFHRKTRNSRTLSLYMTRLNPAIIFLNKDWCQTIHNRTWYRMRFGIFLLHGSTLLVFCFLIQYTVCFENYVLQK